MGPDAVLILLVLALIVFLLAAPTIALVSASRAKKLARQNEERWPQLLGRVYALEQEIKRLAKQVSQIEGSSPLEAHRVGAPSPEEAAPPPPPRVVPPSPAPAAPAQEISRPVVPPRVTPPPPERPPIGERLKSLLKIEEVLGTNWLNKLGIIILVIGVALFVAYQIRESEPWVRVLIGYAVGGGLLGAGVFFEKREGWRLLARAGVGGGWALLFFVTYAMYHVPAARIIQRQWPDLVLLFLVACVMVAHTLRYNSQAVTSLAFLLAFSTVTISRSNAYSLSAGALLATGMVVIALRRQWFELEVIGILATYINHFYWLRPIILAMGGHHRVFPEYTASSLLLTFYWLLFRASYVMRRPDGKRMEDVSTVAAILNAGVYVWVMGYQSVHPELAFQFLLAVGAAELAVGQLAATRRRRTAFVILTTLGAVLVTTAFPYRYSGSNLSLLWLAEAEAFFLAGVLTREVVFRRLSVLAGFLTAGQIAVADTLRVIRTRSAAAAELPQFNLAWVYGLAALALYFNAHVATRRWLALAEKKFDRYALKIVSYAAGVLALLGLWVASNEFWMGLAWCALAFVPIYFGARWKILELSVQGHCVAAIALLRIILVNIQTVEVARQVSLRLPIVSLAAALVYIASRWAGRGAIEKAQRVGQTYTWAASAVVALLAWYQLQPVGVALAWALLGLALFQLGIGRRSASLRFQGYVALASSFFRLFFVNLNAEGYPGELSARVYTTIPLAVIFIYGYWRLQDSSGDFLELDRRLRAAGLFAWMGTLTVAALMRFELPPDAVVATWAALIMGLLGVAWKFERRIFLHQGLVLGFAVLFRAVLHNLYQRSYFPPPSFWYGRWFSLGVAVALLFGALPFAYRLRVKEEAATGGAPGRVRRTLSALARRPEQVCFFLAFIVLTLLLAFEMRKGMVTVAWGAEAVAVFLFALWAGERSFRLSGLGLLFLCVGKIVFKDVWGLAARDRYLTFIALGTALLGVSFLYTRYRETIRQYL